MGYLSCCEVLAFIFLEFSNLFSIATTLYILSLSLLSFTDERVVQSMYADHQSVYRTKKHPAATCPTKTKKSHMLSSSTSALPTTEYCDCTARKCIWYVFDNDLVLPEYVVDFEYLTNVSFFKLMNLVNLVVEKITTLGK